MSKLVLPEIDKKTLDKKEYIFKALAKLINSENILSHADEIKPYETVYR
jgi:glycolate oxidase